MKKIVIPAVIVLLVVACGLSAFYFLIQPEEEPLIETFSTGVPVTSDQKSFEYAGKFITFFATAEQGKKRYGYASSFRFPFVGKNAYIGNVASGDGFYYLASMNFNVSPGMRNCNPAISDIKYYGLPDSNTNISLHWPGYRRSLVYIWGVNNHFKNTHRAGELEKLPEGYGALMDNEIELSLKEYAYIGNTDRVGELYLQSDFPFKLKLSHCPDQFYVVNPEGEIGAMFKLDTASSTISGRKCIKGQKRKSYPEGIYVYDPPEFATQGITIKVGIKKK